MSILRRPFLMVIGVLAALAAAPSAAGAADPIEGTWFFGGGQVLVQPTGPSTFKGTVVVATTFDECAHPVGERMWDITKSGTTYSGTHDGRQSGTCETDFDQQATWSVRVEEGRFILDFCTGWGCSALQRAKPPTQRPRLRVKPKQVRAGRVVTIDGWVPGCPEEILVLSSAFKPSLAEFAGVPGIDAAIRNAEGYFKVKTRIPRGQRPDRYTISGRCGGGNVGSVNLRVLRPRS